MSFWVFWTAVCVSKILVERQSDFNFGTGDFSMSLWVNPSVISLGNKIIGKDTNVDTGIFTGYYLQIVEGRVRFTTRNTSDSNRNAMLDSLQTVNTNNWVYLTAIRKNNILYLYINSALDSTLVETTPIDVSNNVQFKIGAFDESNYEIFRGSLDDVRIYNRALSVSEVQQLYTGNPTPVGYNPQWLIATLISLMGAGGYLIRRRTAKQ